MVTAQDPNAPDSPRIRRHLPRFRQAMPPDPDHGDWSAWEALLADDTFGEAGVAEALRVPPVRGFGTVCASLMALGRSGEAFWRFSRAAPGTVPFEDVRLTAT